VARNAKIFTPMVSVHFSPYIFWRRHHGTDVATRQSSWQSSAAGSRVCDGMCDSFARQEARPADRRAVDPLFRAHLADRNVAALRIVILVKNGASVQQASAPS